MTDTYFLLSKLSTSIPIAPLNAPHSPQSFNMKNDSKTFIIYCFGKHKSKSLILCNRKKATRLSHKDNNVDHHRPTVVNIDKKRF